MKISEGWKFTLNRRISVLLFLMVAIGIYSCKNKENIFDKKIDKEVVFNRSADFDFPWKTNFPLDNNNLEQKLILQDLINKWYEEDLKPLNEPNLSQLKDSSYVIRISNWGPWGEYRIQRLEKSNNKWNIHLKIYYKNDKGEFFIDESTNLDDSTKIINIENKIKKFNKSFHPTFNESGLDGETYILEVYKNGRYDLIERWSPRIENEAEFMEICTMIEEIYTGKKDAENPNL